MPLALSFATKFDNFRDSSGVEQILAQFAQDPEKVELREVCKLRNSSGRIELLLRQVTPEELEQVRRHNNLYNSAVFRIIQDRVLEQTRR